MNFHRAAGDYSLVEQAVLRALGRENFDFKPINEERAPSPGWVARAYDELRERDEIRFDDSEI